MSDALQFMTETDHSQSSILWKSDGVFYCRLQMSEPGSMVTLALHGISSETEAVEAFKALQERFQGAAAA